MLRSSLAVVAGFALWSVLWLAANASLQAAAPGAYRADGLTDSTPLLAGVVAISVAISFVSGRVTRWIAPRGTAPVLCLAVLLLAVGIAVQASVWDKLPLWYHLSFLGLLVPATLLGGRANGAGARIAVPN